MQEASAILDEREPADAAAFKSWLFSVSRRVAEAASEGGFLGFGGVQVSAAERATLDEIAEALGIADQPSAYIARRERLLSRQKGLFAALHALAIMGSLR